MDGGEEEETAQAQGRGEYTKAQGKRKEGEGEEEGKKNAEGPREREGQEVQDAQEERFIQKAARALIGQVDMSLALAAGLKLPIAEAEAVTKSWPNFFAAIRPLGVEVEYA